MKIPIVPGTLCWLTATPYPSNNGKVAEVVAAAGPAIWLCTSKESILGACGNLVIEAAPGQQFLAHVHNLIPIAGPGLEDEVKNFDNIDSHKELYAPHPLGNALAAHLYGRGMPRSTPNVRR